MEPLSPQGARRGLGLGWAAGLLTVASGCVPLESFLAQVAPPPGAAVCQVVATWQNKVMFTPDPVHGGTLTPGLAGRLYLFGPQIDFPLVGDGAVVIDLYDDNPAGAGKPPVHLERWQIDRDTLKRLLRQDAIGWGYTLFLPWATYKPETTHVRLTLCYVPAQGIPLYAPPTTLTLVPGTDFAPQVARQPSGGAANGTPTVSVSR